VHRGPPAKLSPSNVLSTKPGSLYPLLTSGDTRYKLAPLNRAYRSPSPESSRSTVDGDSLISGESSPSSSPVIRNTVLLPSLRSIAPPPSIRPSESDDLAFRVKRIELDRRSGDILVDERHKHAALLWNLLISINTNYIRQFGIPNVKEEEGDMKMNLISNELSHDIEMAV
jgi:hypothetical protein